MVSIDPKLFDADSTQMVEGKCDQWLSKNGQQRFRQHVREQAVSLSRHQARALYEREQSSTNGNLAGRDGECKEIRRIGVRAERRLTRRPRRPEARFVASIDLFAYFALRRCPSSVVPIDFRS